jgi:hypothetical protein
LRIKAKVGFLLILTACLTLLAEVSSAQIIYGDPARGDISPVYQHWKLTYKDIASQPDTTLTQIATPVHLFLPIANDWEIHVNTGISNSSVNGGTGSQSLTALSTPLVRVYHSFSEDRVFVCAGVSPPGGKTKLDSTELALAELVSDDYLLLPVKQLGAGVGVLLQIGGADQYQQLLFGGSVSYYLRGSYTFAKGGGDYNPGDEFTVQGTATLPLDRGRIDLDLGYKYYVSDKLESEKIFKNGDQFSFALSGSYEFGETVGNLGFLFLLRGKDSRRSGEVFNYEPYNSNGNKTVFSGSIRHSFTQFVAAEFLTAYRVVAANKWAETDPSYFGKSDLFSIGAGASFSADNDRYSLFGRLMLHNGSGNDSAISISGTEITIGGRVRL